MATRRRKRDYYEVLGVDRSADAAELKRAFRELARRYHPDVNPGDALAEDRFKEANEAFAVLSDPRLRARYDRHGFAGVDAGAAAGQPPGFASVSEALDELRDLWRRRQKRQRGRDLRYTLEIGFEEAALGCNKTIVVPRPDGAGGTRSQEFAVNIPPGTKEGAVRMLKGEGEAGIDGGPPGDLHVIVRVREHALYRREGNDVWCDIPVSFAQAALGSTVEVPTLEGKVRMRIPAGTQSGRVFRLRGKGIPRGTSRAALRGDQMVRIVVETPTVLSTRQRELLEQLAAESGDVPAHPQRSDFLEKLRVLFPE